MSQSDAPTPFPGDGGTLTPDIERAIEVFGWHDADIQKLDSLYREAVKSVDSSRKVMPADYVLRLERHRDSLRNHLVGQVSERLARRQAFDDTRARGLYEAFEYWLRRFFTTLAIANSAAFVAIAAGVAQSDNPEKIGPYLGSPMGMFAAGLIVAGLIPVIMGLGVYWDIQVVRRGSPERRRSGHQYPQLWAGAAASVSATCFIAGVLAVVGVLNGLRP